MFSAISIQDELIKAKQKNAQLQHALTQQIEENKKKGLATDEFLMKRMRMAPKPGRLNINTDQLSKSNVFSIDDIKSVCVQYRLRFLDNKYYKDSELPDDSKAAIGNVSKLLGKEMGGVKIVESASLLKLKITNKDPLLFVPIDDTNFYLIHSWSKNFSWYKKWLNYPFISIWTLLLSLIVIGLPLTFIVPAIIFRTPEDVEYYQMLYLAAFSIGTLFTMVFGGFTFYKKFSRTCWNSPALS